MDLTIRKTDDRLMYLSYQARRSILELIYKSLCLKIPDWTDEFDVAIKTADPSHHRPEWRLGDGFTAAEGFDILPDCSVPCFEIRQPDNLDDITLSRSTVERSRNESRVELDKEAKAQFSMKKPKYSVIHWDGKIVSDMRGDGVELVYY